MLALPPAAEPLISALGGAFTRPSFARFVVLCVGSIVTLGRRSVSRILWTVRTMAAGDPSSYHRLLSRAAWSPWPLGKVLAAAVLELIPTDQSVRCAVDDTVTRHRGERVYGKGCHRDAVRSTRGGAHTATKWGHKWVVLAILVRLPFASRPWALPVLCALYRVPRADREEGRRRRRHKTPCDLARGMLATLLRALVDRGHLRGGAGPLGPGDAAATVQTVGAPHHAVPAGAVQRGQPDLHASVASGAHPRPSGRFIRPRATARRSRPSPTRCTRCGG